MKDSMINGMYRFIRIKGVLWSWHVGQIAETMENPPDFEALEAYRNGGDALHSTR